MTNDQKLEKKTITKTSKQINKLILNNSIIYLTLYLILFNYDKKEIYLYYSNKTK